MTASGKTRAPISTHPVFPAVVALWFAALLGLGSMVLPVVLLEKLTTATGLAAVLTAAQPPLGVTARILIALAAAVLGVLSGLAIARKVAAAQAVETPRRRSPKISQVDDDYDAPAKRPISAREELGVERLDTPVAGAQAPRAASIPGRRRALSVTDEHGRSDFLESAPLPGFDAYGPPAAGADPLDLGEFAEPPRERPDMASFGRNSLSGPPPSPQTFMPPPQRYLAEAEAETYSSAERDAPADATEAPVQAFVVADEEFDRAAAEETDMSDRARFNASGSEVGAVTEPAPFAAPRIEIASLPLRDLRMIELVERFALSLQRRAEPEVEDAALELPQLKAAPAARPAAPFAPAAQSGPAVPAAFATEATFSPVPAPDAAPELTTAARGPADAPPAPEIPAALRPIGLDDDDDDGEATAEPSFGLSLSLDPAARPFARPAGETAADAPARPASPREVVLEVDDGADDADVAEEGEGYSSLLAMKSPLGANREFVRIEDESESEDADAVEPVVVFPGQQQQRRAAPASDGPSRDPMSQRPVAQPGLRPFDGPTAGASATHGAFAAPAALTGPPDKRPDPAATERALRDALEKLQKMSGVA